MFHISSCSCLCPIQWSQVLSREWRYSWSSADRWCSNYIWVIDNFIAHYSASYIRDLTVHPISSTPICLLKFILKCSSGFHYLVGPWEILRSLLVLFWKSNFDDPSCICYLSWLIWINIAWFIYLEKQVNFWVQTIFCYFGWTSLSLWVLVLCIYGAKSHIFYL